MSYFFASQNLMAGEEAIIAGEEAHHLMHARRIRIGEAIKLQGPDKRRFRAVISEIGRRNITVHVDEEIKVPREPRIHIHLFQACTKEKTIDVILQKGTELGVEQIHFFQSSNSPQQLLDGANDKLERWANIALESAKQCDRVVWPAIEIIKDEEELEKQVLAMDHFYIIDAKGKKSLSHMASEIPKLLGLSVGICIGPEGGLSEEELAQFAKSTNAIMAHLGPRTLRASTAAPVAISIIQSILGDMQ
ncbi:MAG: RsmE family RNA methyltransferase [Candidatus Paceibacterota bacterium]|jgi:16S rRNA (uracil1498-N3)-methyltransferase